MCKMMTMMICGMILVMTNVYANEVLLLLPITKISQTKRQNGTITVTVTSRASCGIEPVGTSQKMVLPINLSNPHIEIRSIGKDTGRKCQGADQSVTDSFDLPAIAGIYKLLDINP